jgi:hypothetical protein
VELQATSPYSRHANVLDHGRAELFAVFVRAGEVKALRWREDVDMIATTTTANQQRERHVARSTACSSDEHLAMGSSTRS